MPDPNISIASRFTRYMQVILFVGIYIVCGYLLHLEATAYLLLGIPFTLLFQLFIAKKPIHQLWLRDEKKFYLNKWGWIIAILLMVFPIYQIIDLVIHNQLTWVLFGYYTAAFLGAFCAGYSFSRFTKKTLRDFFTCFIIVVLIRVLLYFFPFLTGKHEFRFDYMQGIRSLLTYIPIAFVVEEVVFRGMLDTYIHPAKRAKGLWSAIFISVLWGLWHLPLHVNSESSMGFIVLTRILVSSWGIILSIFWRRTGNLAVPAFSHAFANAIRDAFAI
jgi:membrane protease YdiL (CAAX protease family)